MILLSKKYGVNVKIRLPALFCLFSLGALPLVADNVDDEIAVRDDYLPRFPDPPLSPGPVISPDTVLMQRCIGLVLVSSPSKMLSSQELSSIKGFKLVGVTVPGGEKGLEKQLTPLYQNRSLTVARVRKIQYVIRNYFRDNGQPMQVEIPRQSVKEGVLQILVMEDNH